MSKDKLSIKRINDSLTEHTGATNPHNITKTTLGLANVTNDKQAKEVDLGNKTNLVTPVKTDIVSGINSHVNDYIKNPPYATVTGSGAYIATLNPAPASLVAGLGIVIKPSADSTVDSTLNINNLGAKPIINMSGKKVKLKKDIVYTLRYDGTGSFILQAESGGGLTTVDVFNGPYVGGLSKFVVIDRGITIEARAGYISVFKTNPKTPILTKRDVSGSLYDFIYKIEEGILSFYEVESGNLVLSFNTEGKVYREVIHYSPSEDLVVLAGPSTTDGDNNMTVTCYKATSGEVIKTGKTSHFNNKTYRMKQGNGNVLPLTANFREYAMFTVHDSYNFPSASVYLYERVMVFRYGNSIGSDIYEECMYPTVLYGDNMQ